MDIANLAMRVDSTDVKKATDELHKMQPAADQAENSVGKLNKTFMTMGNKLSGQITGALHELRGALVGVAVGLAANFGFERIIDALTETSESIDQISKAASKMRVPIDQMQALGLAADLAGQDFSQITMSVQKMNKVLGDAIARGKGSEGVFKILGTSAKDLAAMPLPERLGFIADKMNSMNLTADQTALILGKLGDRSGSLAALFEGGSKGIQEADEMLKRFNGDLTTPQGKQVEAMNDAWTALTYSIRAAVVQAVAFSAVFGANLFSGVAETIGAITSGIKYLATSASAVAGAIRAGVGAIVNMLFPIKTIYDAIVSLNELFKKVFGVSIVTAARDGINKLINVVKGSIYFIGTLMNSIGPIFEAAFLNGVNLANAQLNRLNNAVQNVVASIAGALASISGKESTFKPTYDIIPTIDTEGINAKVAGIFQKAKDAYTAQQSVDNFASAVTKSDDATKKQNSSLTDLSGLLENTGTKADAAAAKLTALEKIGKEFDALGAPFSQANDDVGKLDELLKNGVINNDQYAASLQRVKDAFMAAGGTSGQWSNIMQQHLTETQQAFKDFGTNALTQVGDAFITFAQTGKISMRDLVNSVIADLLRMVWQITVVKPLINSLFGGGSLLGGLFGGGAAVAGGGAVAGAAVGTANKSTPFANPTNVVDARAQFDAIRNVNAGNQIRNTAAAPIVYQNTVNIHPVSTGDDEKDRRHAEDTGKQARDQLQAMIDERIANANTYGGMLRPRGFG